MTDKLKKSLKYVIIALVIYISGNTIPKTEIPKKDLLMLAMVSSITFALLDMYAPCVATPNK